MSVVLEHMSSEEVSTVGGRFNIESQILHVGYSKLPH